MEGAIHDHVLNVTVVVPAKADTEFLVCALRSLAGHAGY